MANTNPLTLTRQQLYDLVWRKPVRDVAKDFGMSDVALAKRCRAVRVPIPPRGYWARVAAGQTPRKISLPKYRGGRNKAGGSVASEDRLAAGLGVRANKGESHATNAAPRTAAEEPTVTFTPRLTPAPAPTQPANPPSPEESALRARIDALEIAPLDSLTEAHPAVLRTARMLKRPWRKDIEWARGTRRGPVLQVSNVSEAQLDRALRALDAVLRGADALGWHFIAPPMKEPDARRNYTGWAHRPPEPPAFGRIKVDGEPMQLKIDERRRQFDHVPTDAEKADKKAGRYVWMSRFDFEASGELRLHLFDAESSLTRKTWKDTGTRPLETLARKILRGLLDRALEIKRDREERRLRDIAWREQERQQAIVRARRAASEELIHELERQAGAWSRAQLLRRYLRAASRAVGPEGFLVKSDEGPLDFFAWAAHYVNQLDPLHPEPHDPDLQHERTFRYGSDEKRAADEQQRLSGHAWESCLKLVAEFTDTDDDPAVDDDE